MAQANQKIVAIHQPNFFPWLGYFDKIIRADVFILLDHVQFSKKGGTWCNRVKIVQQGQAKWLTVPVDRAYHGTRTIRDMSFNRNIFWQRKLLQAIRINYGKAPYFNDVFPVLAECIQCSTDSLAEYNIVAIQRLLTCLGLDCQKLVISSTLSVEGQATDLLVALVQKMEGTAYLCGGGAEGYQEDEKFAEAGLQLAYQRFEHPVYPQYNTKEFIPGLSIIDYLMNCGFDSSILKKEKKI